MQEVYQQNERLMYAIALKYASNTQDCEDIVHDTVEKLCKNIIKIKGLPNSALRAYVVYAVRNTAINFRKHQSTINRHIQQLSGDDSNSEYDQPESIIERIEDLQEKRTCPRFALLVFRSYMFETQSAPEYRPGSSTD